MPIVCHGCKSTKVSVAKPLGEDILYFCRKCYLKAQPVISQPTAVSQISIQPQKRRKRFRGKLKKEQIRPEEMTKEQKEIARRLGMFRNG